MDGLHGVDRASALSSCGSLQPASHTHAFPYMTLVPDLGSKKSGRCPCELALGAMLTSLPGQKCFKVVCMYGPMGICHDSTVVAAKDARPEYLHHLLP